MAVDTWVDERGNTFSEPYIPTKIVGFQGIAPAFIPEGTIDEEKLANLIDARIEHYMATH